MTSTKMDARKEQMTRTEKFPIDRPFTNEQLQKKGHTLASLLDEKSQLEDELKEKTAELKAQIKAKEAEINITRKHLTNKTENVLVEGEVIYDAKLGEKRFMYQDKVWNVLPLDAKDMQIELDIAEGKAE